MTDNERRAYNREKTQRYRANNPDKVATARVAARMKSRRRKHWLAKIKTAVGCCACGFNGHHSALDFDHVSPQAKSFHIAKSLNGRALKALFEEIRKCRVLCANCHRVHTYNQAQGRLIHAGT